MSTVEKMTVSLPKELVRSLKRKVPTRKRSRFIAEIIRERLESLEREALKKAYMNAYGEIKNESQQLNGTISDGIS